LVDIRHRGSDDEIGRLLDFIEDEPQLGELQVFNPSA
jgi:hypothetical protein